MEDGIFFNQSKYIKEMLKKFGLEDSKPSKMPMSTEIKLTKDDEADSLDSSKYRGMIGSLLYLAASRPDIMFSVCLCARFQENPKTTHLESVKRIFRLKCLELIVVTNQTVPVSHGWKTPFPIYLASKCFRHPTYHEIYDPDQGHDAYPLPLDTAYRSSGTKTDSKFSIFDFRAKKIFYLSSEQILLIVYPLLQNTIGEEEEREDRQWRGNMEQSSMSKTRTNYGSGVARPKIEQKDSFELKGQFLEELQKNPFRGSILDSRDAIPTKTVADAKMAIQEMAEYSQKWHNGNI
ncbi:hypothetical protein Tco_1503566 [Tanacetum coccineum]